MGKPTICIGENKGADHTDQRLCFRYMDSTIPLLSKSKISCLQPFSVLVQLGLCQTWSETTLLVYPRAGSFLTRYIFCFSESTPEGRRVTKLDQILLNGNNITMVMFFLIFLIYLIHLSLASLLWDIGKQNSPRCDAAECGIPSGAFLFA